MAFDPLHFLVLAGDMELESEAQIRTAINRAYYAVFLKARDSLIARGILEQRAAEFEHGRVIHALRSNYRGQAAIRLAQLRGLRELADYDTAGTVGRRVATEALQIASDIRRLMARDWGVA